MARVSVIIPAYNSEHQIAAAIRSVESQTYGDWEVVVGDDASTDSTAEVAEGFGPRVKVVRGDRNGGPAHARNIAIGAASGELLVFLDADDLLLPEYLAGQVELYDRAEAEQAGVGIVACDALLEGPDGRMDGTYLDRIPFPDPLTVADLLVENPIYVSAVAPREVVEEAGGFSTECVGTEDWDLWIRILERGYRAVVNRKALAVYHVAEGSVSADSGAMARNIQIAYERALARGGLGPRERRIARRELRVARLVEEMAEIQAVRRSGGRMPLGRAVKSAPRAVAVATRNPGRVGRIAKRILRGSGSLQDRVLPEREAALRRDGLD